MAMENKESGKLNRIKTTSPTVRDLPSNLTQPKPNIACANCPKANWYATPETLSCYCRAMYMITWTTITVGNIVACDAQLEREQPEPA